MYRLQFGAARAEAAAFERTNPDDPLGITAEAASYLFEEFNEKGVFTSAFFLNDDRLLGGVEGSPTKNRNTKFLDANRRARELAQKRLASQPNDAEALLVLTLADGMESNYDSFIEKRQLASLSLIKHAESEAGKLLAIDPDAKDAWVAIGTANYIIGCLPLHKRAFLWFGGIRGDKLHGMEQVEWAAKGGSYLRPFAKILLALADEREHHYDRARELLADLAHEYPENPHFAEELAIAEKMARKK